MSEAERNLLRLVNARVARLQPELARTYRQWIAQLSKEFGAKRVVDLISSGRIDLLLTDEALSQGLSGFNAQIQNTLREGFRLTLPDIPGAVVSSQPQVFFDVLNPRVTRAIGSLESRTLDTLKESVRATVRSTVTEGLALGKHPTAIARDLRESVGLSAQQAKYIRNMRAELESLDPRVLSRVLRDKRFDATIKKAVSEGKPIPADRITKMVDAYQRKFTAYNTELNTREVALDGYRLAQWESYASAIDRGIIERDEAEKVWIHFELQKNPRADHKAWHRTVVGFYEAFPDGQQQAGLGYYNCRCSTLYRTKRKAIYPQPLTPGLPARTTALPF